MPSSSGTSRRTPAFVSPAAAALPRAPQGRPSYSLLPPSEWPVIFRSMGVADRALGLGLSDSHTRAVGRRASVYPGGLEPVSSRG